MARKRNRASFAVSDEDEEARSTKRAREGDIEADVVKAVAAPAALIDENDDAREQMADDQVRSLQDDADVEVRGSAALIGAVSVTDSDGLLEVALNRRRRDASPAPTAIQMPATAVEAPPVTTVAPTAIANRNLLRWGVAPLVAFVLTLAVSGPSGPTGHGVEVYERFLWAHARSRQEWWPWDRMSPSTLHSEVERAREVRVAVENTLGDINGFRERAIAEAYLAGKDARLSATQLDFIVPSLETSRLEAIGRAIDELKTPRAASWDNAALFERAAAPPGSDVRLDVSAFVAKRFDNTRGATFDYASTRTGGRIVTANTTGYLTSSLAFFQTFAPSASIILASGGAALSTVKVGDCWAFQGSTGHAMIKLAIPTVPTAFALVHAPAHAVGFGDAKSAPRNFEIFGYPALTDSPIHLGSFTFDPQQSDVATFPAQLAPFPVSFVELNVLSNYGAQNYTCVYRFAVY